MVAYTHCPSALIIIAQGGVTKEKKTSRKYAYMILIP